jgi:hypothetical protein
MGSSTTMSQSIGIGSGVGGKQHLADRLFESLHERGWELGISGFANAGGRRWWVVMARRGDRYLQAEAATQLEAMLQLAHEAAA